MNFRKNRSTYISLFVFYSIYQSFFPSYALSIDSINHRSKTVQLETSKEFVNLAQSNSRLIYLGTIGSYEVYQNAGDGLILVFVSGAIWAFSSISSAVSYIGEAFFAKDSSKPSASECDTAIKILTQYERLAGKFNIKLSADKIGQLNAKRDSGQITIYDLPAGLRGKFPGRFTGKTLEEIIKECGR